MTGYELQYISSTNGAFDCTLAANATSTSVIEQKFLSTSYFNFAIYFGVDYADVKLNDRGLMKLFWYNAGAVDATQYWTLNEEHTVSLSASEYKWNGVKIYDTAGTVGIPSTPRVRTAVRGHINYFKITDNGVDRVNLVAWQDGNGNLGLYDKVNDVFYTPSSGTWTAGPRAHIFTIDKSNTRFASSGGTETVEIEAETTWTASTPSFVSVSPSTGDTGTTQVTISCPSYTGETRREDVITFTDNDDYTLTFKARQNGNSAGFSNIYLGDNNLLSNTIFLGDNAVNTIYLGEEIIYSNGPFVGLKASPKTLQLDNNHNTANITIRSSENWTITDDSGGWLSYSTTTGTTGKTVVTVTATTTQADRTATITVTSANYSATTTVQNAEHFYLQPQSNEIYYTTRSGNPIGSEYNEGINIESITYDGDYGIITFDGTPYLKGIYTGGHFGGTGDVTCWWLPESITTNNMPKYCFEWQDYCTEMFCYMTSNVPSKIFQSVQETTPAIMHIPAGASSAYTNSGIYASNKSNWTVVEDL